MTDGIIFYLTSYIVGYVVEIYHTHGVTGGCICWYGCDTHVKAPTLQHPDPDP